MLIDFVDELKNCKNLSELKMFVNKHNEKDKYFANFREALMKETVFDKALQRVWNFALQQDGKYFLGKVGFAKRKGGTAIGGMECHSEGHR